MTHVRENNLVDQDWCHLVFNWIYGPSLWHVCAIPRKYIKVSHERNDLTTMCASIFISVAWRLQHDQQFYTNWATTGSVKYLKPKVLGSSHGRVCRWLHSWSGRPGPDLEPQPGQKQTEILTIAVRTAGAAGLGYTHLKISMKSA